MGFTIGDDKMQRDCLRELKVDDFGIESFSFIHILSAMTQSKL